MNYPCGCCTASGPDMSDPLLTRFYLLFCDDHYEQGKSIVESIPDQLKLPETKA